MRFPRRRKFVIDTTLQVSVLLITLGYVFFLLLVISVSLFAPLVLQLSRTDAHSLEASNAALSILYLHNRFWLPVLLALVVIVLHSLRTTHSIAGPLYRFRRVFEAISNGVLPRPVRLRRGDYLGSEMTAINTMLDTLRDQIGRMQQHAESLHDGLTRYRDLAKGLQGDAATDGLWDDIVRADAQLRDALDGFRIEELPAPVNQPSSRPS